MKRFLTTIILLLACASGAMAAHVAVLETGVDQSVKKKVKLSDRQYLTNVLREEAVKQLPAEEDYTIMTRDNISAMLPPGKAIEDCEGSCLAETGRNISADYVCQARVSSFGSKLALSAEIYETAGKKLVASFNGNGKNVDFWHPQRESNPQLTLRRGLLYPFNYGGVLIIIPFSSRKCNTFHKFRHFKIAQMC